jgi:type II secretion system protein G
MGKVPVKNWGYSYRLTRFAFTLAEVLIVVAILGILAAFVIPEYRNYVQKARESAAKENLQILRTAIERYAIEHNGVPPGYPLNNPKTNPTQGTFSMHLVNSYYLTSLPKNPFNDKATLIMIGNNQEFQAEPSNTDIYGWIYKPQTKSIKLNWKGIDLTGKAYFDY